ncbi:VPS35B, partial [Symbiodinium sp. KB8]
MASADAGQAPKVCWTVKHIAATPLHPPFPAHRQGGLAVRHGCRFPDSQAAAVEHVEIQASHMKVAVVRGILRADKNNLKDALKHASAMLQELRASKLSPRTYFDLYHRVFDHLLFLELFFESVAASGTPVRDLYEMVQHAGNVLTRLYLMVTVASVFIKSRELPVKDILVDLLEMAKGVQHPTRGLFLRYYMLQKCEDKLPEEGSEYAGEGGGPEDALKFVMTIFVEMNKLWVRMQHSKEHRSTKRREKERREIRAVVATAVGRIGSLQGLSLHTFATNEFLLDSITQCFPPTFSVCTLIPYLRTVLACEASVDCHKVISGHISRITDAISRESDAPALGAREAADMQAATEAAAGLGFYDQLALGEDTFNPEAP